MRYNASDQVTVLIICLLYTFNSEEIPFLNAITRNILMFLAAYLPYFFAYKVEFLFFQNNPKDLDPSCKTDLDLLDCLGRVNLVL